MGVKELVANSADKVLTMDSICRVIENAFAKRMRLNFEVVEDRGPDRFHSYEMGCYCNGRANWHKPTATASSERRWIRSVCTLVDADIRDLPDIEVDTDNEEYKVVCQAYGKIATQYLRETANEVEGGLTIDYQPIIMLEGIQPEDFNSKRYIALHVIACLVYDELKYHYFRMNTVYVKLMADQLRSRMRTSVTHLPDGNVTVSFDTMRVEDRNELAKSTDTDFSNLLDVVDDVNDVNDSEYKAICQKLASLWHINQGIECK